MIIKISLVHYQYTFCVDSGIDSEPGKTGSNFSLSNMGTLEGLLDLFDLFPFKPCTIFVGTPDTAAIRKKITEVYF